MMTPIFSLENLHRQYLHCRRNKRNTPNALRFEFRLEDNLIRLQEELEGRTYTPSRSVCFVLKQPKLREIFAADFRDRVVHHILVDALEGIWERLFIYDSYACRKGKGTHRAVRRLQAFTRRVSHNGTRRAHFLHLDVCGFFLHIDKEVLYQIVKKRVRDENVLWLARTVIFHDCTRDYVLKGRRGLLEKIPPHKTLFGAQNTRGLPIGNLTSQFFANVYLNELDQFVKHRLKARYYVRYCDDFVLLHEEKERLQAWKEAIAEFLRSRLRLALNERCETSGPISNGIDFLGYIVRPDYLLARRRVVNRLKARLADYEKRSVRREKEFTLFRYDHATLEELAATWASYLAHLRMANTHRLREKLWGRFAWLSDFFQQDGDQLKRAHLAPPAPQGLKGQHRFFLGKYPGSFLLVQVGRFYELYNEQAVAAYRILKLNRIGAGRGFQIRCGFPVALRRRVLRHLMRLGFTVTVVREEDDWAFGVKKRSLAERWVPISTVAKGVGYELL